MQYSWYVIWIEGTGYSKDIGFKTGALFLSAPSFKIHHPFKIYNAYFLDPYPCHDITLVSICYGMLVPSSNLLG